ncbi:hypothetical protein JHW43_003910 [Diplocarpon mali]|nr:hypothetical protein JHW43_003910 [Diplocarpon mali]
MAFIFTMRSTPIGSMHRRDPRSAGSLPAISEDGVSFLDPRQPPPVPPRAFNRPESKQYAFGAPPGMSFNGSPPRYIHYDKSADGQSPSGETLSDRRKRGVTDSKYFVKRGGWKRLAVIVIVVISCLVGLIVGLVFGLRNRHAKSNKNVNIHGGASGTIDDPSNPAANATFPAGSYRISTYLSTLTTNCTSDPATWRCYPYFTYAQSPTQATAIFDWIITPVENSDKYSISSTENYFSFVFANASLSLMNAGADDEHYLFQISMQKPTKPVAQLGEQNVASTCYFNSTTLQGSLYTRMPKTFSPNDTNGQVEIQALTAWPYAVRIEQVAAAAQGTPTCLDPQGMSLGDFSVPDTTQECDCLYMNTGA